MLLIQLIFFCFYKKKRKGRKKNTQGAQNVKFIRFREPSIFFTNPAFRFFSEIKKTMRNFHTYYFFYLRTSMSA